MFNSRIAGGVLADGVNSLVELRDIHLRSFIIEKNLLDRCTGHCDSRNDLRAEQRCYRSNSNGESVSVET